MNTQLSTGGLGPPGATWVLGARQRPEQVIGEKWLQSSHPMPMRQHSRTMQAKTLLMFAVSWVHQCFIHLPGGDMQAFCRRN